MSSSFVWKATVDLQSGAYKVILANEHRIKFDADDEVNHVEELFDSNDRAIRFCLVMSRKLLDSDIPTNEVGICSHVRPSVPGKEYQYLVHCNYKKQLWKVHKLHKEEKPTTMISVGMSIRTFHQRRAACVYRDAMETAWSELPIGEGQANVIECIDE